MSSAFPGLAVVPGRGRRLLLLALLATAGAFSASVPSVPPQPSVPAPSVPQLSVPAPDRSALAPVADAERSSSPLAAAAQRGGRVPALRMPVAGPVVRGFEARAGPFGPGHRGIDIAAPPGERVRAPAAGRVVFAGTVAGTAWVSLLVAPGVLVTVGPVLDPAVTRGRRVRAHTTVGRLGPGHGVEALARWFPSGEGATLHLGVRVDGVYVDPLAYLVDRPRPRLAPLVAPGGLPAP
jgi:murein DD-endopeptidase MepM/ murein hydrolase activator NlpD